MPSINKPTLIINEPIARRNIKAMAEKARQNNVSFEPHFKTHQSKEVGEWFRDEGVEAITVSSVSMAEYFAENGWGKITIAFPFNMLEISKIEMLLQSVSLTLLVQDSKAIESLELLDDTVNIFIEIDAGYHRSGVGYDHIKEIENIIETVKNSKHQFKGFYCHAGNSYSARGHNEINAVYRDLIHKMQALKRRFKLLKPHTAIGDTPTCSVINEFDGVDSIHPGNFVFYDYTQFEIGSCTISQIATYLQCPVVAKNEERSELIIYGGGVHLSKESLSTLKGLNYGLVGKIENGTYIPYRDSMVKSISQEHGIISSTANVLSKIKVGDIVAIIPIHSCMTVDCMHDIFSNTGKFISKMK